MTQNNNSNRVRKTGKDALPTEGDIPVVDHIVHPFKNSTYLDLHYKDPEKNQHGMITVKTHQMEKSDTYDKNRTRRRKNQDLIDARNTGVHPLETPEKEPFYQGFDVIIAGNQITPHELKIALEKMSEHYGKKFYYTDPDKDNPLDTLPKIEKLCDICEERTPEEQLEIVTAGNITEWRKDKQVCSEKCKAIAEL